MGDRGDTVSQRNFELVARDSSPGTRPARPARCAYRRSLTRQMLCVMLSASVGLVACAGPRAHSAGPVTTMESDPAAHIGVVGPPTEQARPGSTKESPGQTTPRGSGPSANDVGWAVMLIAALPILVTVYVSALPFGSWKWHR